MSGIVDHHDPSPQPSRGPPSPRERSFSPQRPKEFPSHFHGRIFGVGRIMAAAFGIIGILLGLGLSSPSRAADSLSTARGGSAGDSGAFPSMAFWRAVREGNLDVIRRLAEQGLPIDVPDHTGKTPLFYAVERGYGDIGQWLIDEGIDIDQKNPDGDVALIVAVTNGHREIVTMLIEARASIDRRNRRGESALMKAVLAGDVPLTTDLLEAGARSDLGDYTGRTPADLGSNHRNPRMRRLFLSR